MRISTAILAAVTMASSTAVPPHASAQPRAPGDPQVTAVREELRALVSELNAARARRDRAAVERFFGEEFVYAHAMGYVDDRATHVVEALLAEPEAPIRLPLDPPAQLYVYGNGDVAVLRAPTRAAMAGERPVLATTVFAKRDGRWQFMLAQGTLLQPQRTPVPVAAALLDAYVGSYGQDGRLTTSVRREGAGLVVSAAGRTRIPPRALTAVSDSSFFDKLGTEYTFHRGAGGRVTHLVMRNQGGQQTRRERLP